MIRPYLLFTNVLFISVVAVASLLKQTKSTKYCDTFVSHCTLYISFVFPEEILYAYLRVFPDGNAKSIFKGNTFVKIFNIVILKGYCISLGYTFCISIRKYF